MGLADSSEQVNRIIKPNVCVLADHKGPVQGPFLFALWAPMRKAHFVNKVQLARKSRARLCFEQGSPCLLPSLSLPANSAAQVSNTAVNPTLLIYKQARRARAQCTMPLCAD